MQKGGCQCFRGWLARALPIGMKANTGPCTLARAPDGGGSGRGHIPNPRSCACNEVDLFHFNWTRWARSSQAYFFLFIILGSSLPREHDFSSCPSNRLMLPRWPIFLHAIFFLSYLLCCCFVLLYTWTNCIVACLQRELKKSFFCASFLSGEQFNWKLLLAECPSNHVSSQQFTICVK